MHLATPEILNSMITAVRSLAPDGVARVPPVHCEDGLMFSMQAGEFEYCTPRNNVGPWATVEIGFPTERVEKFMRYAENAAEPTQTVYGYVPLEAVCSVINEHGGLAPEYMI